MADRKNKRNFLALQKGIEPPLSTNNRLLIDNKLKSKKELSVSEYLVGIRKGNRSILGQAITLIESSREDHKLLASTIINECLPYVGNSIRVGITGMPGVGKSTLIEELGKSLVKMGKKVAVLAIDPSSSKSKGSILGDKTRMEELAASQDAFIRPSPSCGTLGGVSRMTRESVLLCEAAGYDVIFIETVGIGQSEIAVSSMVDFFLLLMLPGSGDELQGIKRGVVELADLIVVTKADGETVKKAEITRKDFENAVHYLPLKDSGIETKVLACSAIENKGVIDIWNMVTDHIDKTVASQFFEKQRKEQLVHWMDEGIAIQLHDNFYYHPVIREEHAKLTQKVKKGKISPYSAAEKLLSSYFCTVNQGKKTNRID